MEAPPKLKTEFPRDPSIPPQVYPKELNAEI
jgi:hypothetical protein